MPDAPAATESQPENTPAAAADTPEPTEGEATVTVTNGRRRGRRRVMKKKKVKDEDGYLGEEISTCYRTPTNMPQSPKRKLYGSRFPKTSLRRRSPSQPLRNQQVQQRVRPLVVRRGRVALLVSSRRLEATTIHRIYRHRGLTACTV